MLSVLDLKKIPKNKAYKISKKDQTKEEKVQKFMSSLKGTKKSDILLEEPKGKIGIDWVPPLNANIINLSSVGLPSLRGIADVPVEARTNFSWINREHINKYKSFLNLPNDFMSPVFNQGFCGSCWAVATTQTFSDRWAIANRKSNPNFGVTYLLSCSKKKQDEDGVPIGEREGLGCEGGIPSYAFDFIYQIGTTKDTCWNYNWCLQNSSCFTTSSIGEGSTTLNNIIPTCLDYSSCVNVNNRVTSRSAGDTIYRGKRWSDVQSVQVPDTSYFSKIDDATQTIKTMSSLGASKTFTIKPYNTLQERIQNHNNVINDIKEEIYKRGPVTTGYMIIYPHFFGSNDLLVEGTWIDGIYMDPDSDILESLYQREESNRRGVYYGGHAVTIVGWGEQELTFQNVPWFMKNELNLPQEYMQYPYVKEVIRIKNLYNSLRGKKIQYWIIRNSWGTDATNHTNGYCKVAISNPELGIGTKIAIDVPIMLKSGPYTFPFGGVSAPLPQITEQISSENSSTITEPNSPSSPNSPVVSTSTILAQGTTCTAPLVKSTIDNTKVKRRFPYMFIPIILIILAVIFLLYNLKSR